MLHACALSVGTMPAMTTIGLCGACTRARRIRSGKGSTFILCERSRDDPRYVRYPRLPMLDCPGFEPGSPPSGPDPPPGEPRAPVA
jgi:hypothetical protein